MSDEQAYINTDRELWRETPDDYYAPSIHVTEGGGIGIDVGGHVIVMPLRKWHLLATNFRQSSSLTDSGAESVQPEKLNTAHKSGAESSLSSPPHEIKQQGAVPYTDALGHPLARPR